MSKNDSTAPHSSSTGAILVAAGILLSRLSGLVRERAFAHFFGNSAAADIFRAALRILNFLQNLFGEGVLSASFIPVYAQLRAAGKEDQARSLAVLTGLALLALTLIMVSLGIFCAPLLTQLIAPGFSGDRYHMTVRLVQILFPGIGVLVLSAWCLGVLNSHGKFFLSYCAPVMWNATIISALLFFGQYQQDFTLAISIAWGVVLGSIFQTLVQIPTTFSLLKGSQLAWREVSHSFRTVFFNFLPVVVGRGIIQISAYVDSIIASLLPIGALAALSYAQTIYLLPISLFAMSISASLLPSISGVALDDTLQRYAKIKEQLQVNMLRLSFFVVPSSIALFALGDLLIDLLYRSGRFTYDDTIYVWSILACSSIGLLAACSARLYSSTFYALQDTRTPLVIAFFRVVLTILLGFSLALKAPGVFQIDVKWGVAGLGLASGIVSWIELVMLRYALQKRIGKINSFFIVITSLSGAAIIAASVATVLRNIVAGPLMFRAGFLLLVYTAIYLLICYFARLSVARSIIDRMIAKVFRRY